MSDAEWSSPNPPDLPGAGQSLGATHGQRKLTALQLHLGTPNMGSGSGLPIDYVAEMWHLALQLPWSRRQPARQL